MSGQPALVPIEDDDPIVKRIPVYINRAELGDIEFNIFQYMTRPFYRPYGDQGDLESVHRRNTQKTFKMSYSLFRNENFDEEHVLNVQDMYELDDTTDVKNVLTSRNVCLPPSPKMFGHISDRKRVQQNPNSLSNYSSALAVMRDGKLFVTPKVAIQQFRPDLAASAPQDPANRKEAEGAPAKPAAPVLASATKQLNERQALSNYTLWGLQEAEEWLNITDRYGVDSMQASSMLRKLSKIPTKSNEVNEERVMQFSTNMTTYLKELTTVNLESEQAETSKVDISLGTLAELPPKEQVKMVLRNLCVAPFDVIKSKLPKEFKDEQLLDELLEICDVVQGNFVVKSRLMIEDLLADIEPPAQINKDNFYAYCASVRDLLLSIFADSINGEPRTVTPNQVIKIPAFAPFRASGIVGSIFKKCLETIFNNVSTLCERTFKFKCAPDRKMLNIDKVALSGEELKKNTNALVKEVLPARFRALTPTKK